MVESEKELESLLMRVKKESEKRRVKAGLKFSLIKSKIMAFIQSHHFMANRRGKVEAVTDLVFSGSKITADGDCSHEIQRCLLLGRKAMTNLAYSKAEASLY